MVANLANRSSFRQDCKYAITGGERGGGLGTSAAVNRVKRSQQQSEDDEEDEDLMGRPIKLRLLGLALLGERLPPGVV